MPEGLPVHLWTRGRRTDQQRPDLGFRADSGGACPGGSGQGNLLRAVRYIFLHEARLSLPERGQRLCDQFCIRRGDLRACPAWRQMSGRVPCQLRREICYRRHSYIAAFVPKQIASDIYSVMNAAMYYVLSRSTISDRSMIFRGFCRPSMASIRILAASEAISVILLSREVNRGQHSSP